MPIVNINVSQIVSYDNYSDNMEHGMYYAHYLRDDINKPAPMYYGNLISSATKKIIIWDPFFHKSDTKIFSNLRHNVDVKVLSSKCNQQKDSYLDGLIAETESQINTLVKGQCVFYFGFIDTSIYGVDVWNTHDRFLIVDDRYFLVGSSIAHHLEPHDSTGIYEITEHIDKGIIQNAFNKCWKVCENSLMFKVQTI